MTDSSLAHHQVRRTATRLADGRELIYFDDAAAYVSGAQTRRLDDPRPLPPRLTEGTAGPHMRRDPLTGDWIPMASARMNRTFMPAANSCPLCPAQPGSAYSDGEIPATDYDVAVFENRFPALLTVPGAAPAPWSVDGEDLFAAAPAAGRCEVVCFSSQHDASFAQLPATRVRTVIEAWADRTHELSQLDQVLQVFPFENRGPEIGVTLPHPHGQIYAFGYVPSRTGAILTQARDYAARTGRKLLADIVAAEVRAGRRLVAQSDHWVAYVPAAARWPVEVHLAPRRDVLDFPGLTGPERDDLAVVYLDLLRRLDRFFTLADGTALPLPYIAGWHQALTERAGADRQLGRLHLQLLSVRRSPTKLKYLAGVESGMASWISDTTPERIADQLREIS